MPPNRLRTRRKTGRRILNLCWDGLRNHEYQGEILLLLDKCPPSPLGIIARLKKNEDVEKHKKQTDILMTIYVIYTIILEDLINISSQYSL